MYKILVVDDELWIRKGIIAKLQQLETKFSWIGEAEDGETALEMIEKEKPKILITDIRLSNMSGIDLIRQIRSTNPELQIIIISGYAEFKYAEQALNMGVSSYLLKPVSTKVLGEAIHNVIGTLRNKEETLQIKVKNKSLEKSNEVLKMERTINSIFHAMPHEVFGTEHVDYYPYGVEHTHKYMLMLIHVDNSNYEDSDFKYEDLGLMKYAIKNIAEEISPKVGYIIMDNLKDVTQVMIIIANRNAEELQKSFNLFTYDLYGKITKYIGISVTIALSGICDEITRDMFIQAMDAYDMRLICGDNKIYRYDKDGYEEKVSLPEHQLRLLERYIEMRYFKNIEVILYDIFSQDNLKNSSFGFIRNLYFEIIRIILKHGTALDDGKQGVHISQIILGEVINHYDTPKQVVAFLYDSIVEIFGENQDVSINCREIVGKAKDFIQKYYVQDISVKNLANQYAVNPNYFSTIFKQETGVTLTNFLKDTRVLKACELLKNTSSTIGDIAQIVGYEDAQYFYRVFKKTIGQTPLEYRKNNMVEVIKEIDIK